MNDLQETLADVKKTLSVLPEDEEKRQAIWVALTFEMLSKRGTALREIVDGVLELAEFVQELEEQS